MYLKNLTLLGFKSFADKTSLNFQPGVTAIVGPNGCGKSNISDAIRWVLGEQSAKALRGGEMSDVIFNGTDSRKPTGMAEVSLTIGGVDQEHLNLAGVEITFDEVTITRRVFRDGGSEYFLNKNPCRLKDIQQLFMGTGVGRTSYSIMAQGNITQILSSKPEDRRLVFEEAAGITKFKAQKKEAFRKLEYTDQNLLRVADLIREVKRQIGSLQRQAGKARRYKQLAQELQHLDTQLARHQFDVLQAEISQREEAAQDVRAEIETASDSVMRCEDEILLFRQRLSELEHAISASQHRGLDLRGQADRHESRIHFNEERLRELEQQNGRALSEIGESEERREVAERELELVTAQLQASIAALDQHRQTLEAKCQILQDVERELQQQQELLRKRQCEAFAAAQQLSQVRNEIATLDLQRQGNNVRLERLSAEKIQSEEERSRLEARLQQFACNVAAEKQNVVTSRGTLEQRQQRLQELQQQMQLVTQDLDELLRQQTESRSHLAVLQQLEESHEGFSGGAVAALKYTERVLGSLADKLKVPDKYVVAVESALGRHLQLVLTEEPEAAESILADLRANKSGRATIAALGLRKLGPPAAHRAPSPAIVSGVPGGVRALSVIQGEDAVRLLLEDLLTDTWIVPDLEAARHAWQEAQGRFSLVTESGELLSRHGVYTGGYLNGAGSASVPSSILGRKNQIAERAERLDLLQEKVRETSRSKGQLQSEQTALEASLQQAQTDLRTQEVAIATHEGEFKALESSLRNLHQKIDTVVYEIQSLEAQEREGAEKRGHFTVQMDRLEIENQSIEQQLAELNAELELSHQRRELANASLTETKVALAADEQVCASFRNQQRPIELRIQERSELIEQRRNEIGSFISRKAQAETEMHDSRQQIQQLEQERALVNSQAAELSSQRQSQSAEIATREEDLRAQRRRLAELQQTRSGLDVELAQKNMTVQNLRERVQQKYQVNLDSIRSECITITIADEGRPKIETLTPEEMAASGAATDWLAVAEQVAALQKRIEEIGPVNLVAIEEYEETEQRYQFLSTQHDDLVQAKQQLLEVINRINLQTKEMFSDTFEKIRANFRAMFTEIFGGGKADLILVDEGDVLESGIDIVARPPGKQLQSISLLSGGEQTMTAVALLFSIYEVKPSPFCVLDELDAPLDESNINRFVRVLQRFLARSQFVIITHNKRTIGMADVLYGVTMQDRGVSRIVSVKFHKAEEQVAGSTALPLEDPLEADSIDVEEDRLQSREETLEIVMAR